MVHSWCDAYYLAPEMMTNECVAASDIWAVGVIAFLMATGYPPYSGRNNREVMSNIVNWADKSAELENTDEELTKFILSMLQHDKTARPTAE